MQIALQFLNQKVTLIFISANVLPKLIKLDTNHRNTLDKFFLALKIRERESVDDVFVAYILNVISFSLHMMTKVNCTRFGFLSCMQIIGQNGAPRWSKSTNFRFLDKKSSWLLAQPISKYVNISSMKLYLNYMLNYERSQDLAMWLD